MEKIDPNDSRPPKPSTANKVTSKRNLQNTFSVPFITEQISGP